MKLTPSLVCGLLYFLSTVLLASSQKQEDPSMRSSQSLRDIPHRDLLALCGSAFQRTFSAAMQNVIHSIVDSKISKLAGCSSRHYAQVQRELRTVQRGQAFLKERLQETLAEISGALNSSQSATAIDLELVALRVEEKLSQTQWHVEELHRSETAQLSFVENHVAAMSDSLPERLHQIQGDIETVVETRVAEFKEELKQELDVREMSRSEEAEQMKRSLAEMKSGMEAFFASTRDQLTQSLQAFRNEADASRTVLRKELNVTFNQLNGNYHDLATKMDALLNDSRQVIILADDVNASMAHTSRVCDAVEKLRSRAPEKTDLVLVRVDRVLASVDRLPAMVNSSLSRQTSQILEAVGAVRDQIFALSVNRPRLRLVNGSTALEGRLEVFHSDHWGTVCDDDFDNDDAAAVCRHFRFPHAHAQHHRSARFGLGTGPIWMDRVRCPPNAESFARCTHRGWGLHSCSHNRDVGVTCA